MKIPVPKTLYGAFSPMIYANLAFGIGVIQYPLGKPRPIISAIWSTINVSIYFGFVLTANFSQVVRIAGSTTVAENYRNYAYACGVFIVVSLCVAQIKAEIFRRNLQKLNVINDRLNRLGIPYDCDLILKFQIVQFIIAFICIVVIMILDFKYVVYEHPNEFSRVCYLSSTHYWLIFTFLIDTRCTNIFRYFSNRFDRLNSFLVEQNLHKAFEKWVDQKPDDLSPMLQEIQQNVPLNRVADKQGILYIVRETRKIYRELCSTAMELNGVFGIQLLLSLTMPLSLITVLLYNTYVYTMRMMKISPLDKAITEMVPVLWAMFYALKIFGIIHIGESIKREVQRTGQLVHMLLNSAIIYDQAVRNELQIFSLQLIQNPCHLTVCGLYTVDHRLAREMLGTISTAHCHDPNAKHLRTLNHSLKK